MCETGAGRGGPERAFRAGDLSGMSWRYFRKDNDLRGTTGGRRRLGAEHV